MKRFLALASSLAFVFAVGCTDKATENPAGPGLSSGTAMLLSSTIDPWMSSYVDPGLSSAFIPIYSSYVDPGISSWVNPFMSSSVNPMLSSYVNPYLSSAVIIPASSVALVSSSATVKPISSSSYVDPSTQVCGGNMPPPVSGGKSGWASRYWDCSKPSCSWKENTINLNTPNGISKNCSRDNKESICFTPDGQGTASAFDGGPAYTCYSQAPYAKCDKLAYGYAAVPGNSPQCGRCFQLDFDGGTKYGGVKAGHRAIKGKTMIVMASNIGYDVSGGQFDIMIPGGGVGAKNACSGQWGVTDNQLGANLGGLLTACQNEINNYDAALDKFKTCVRGKCNALFGNNPAYADLLKGCNWYADWFETADNPTFTYTEVKCPDELVQGYRSTFH